jgi:pSer/pThr/pTyr-binding forkhead associated (FHA) protein
MILVRKDKPGGGLVVTETETIFGRGTDADHRLKYHSVSRKHAKIIVDDNNNVSLSILIDL